MFKPKLKSGQDDAGHVRVQRGDRASECGSEEWVVREKAHARSAGLEGGGEDRHGSCHAFRLFARFRKSQHRNHTWKWILAKSNRMSVVWKIVFDDFFYFVNRSQNYIKSVRLPYSPFSEAIAKFLAEVHARQEREKATNVKEEKRDGTVSIP